ncbi:MAG: cytochrome ubiquinol oxidase subunit I [Acidobacteriia bacterium]|nr:cytochrome ubiquinol oxidase subunit I [Terriglobia bacterium]
MDVLMLARLQFALTIGFHYIFPPFSIGLGLILVVMEGTYLATRRQLYHEMTRYWVKIFGLMFAIGVASGIVMEFQFGTNWAAYSRFVGDVFGSALAAEGIFAFFLESGFLALLLFGWDRVSPRMHFFSTLMVSLGSIFSAVWIIVANSWQQTPAGFHLVETTSGIRAEVVSFQDVILNPSTLDRLSHVLAAALQTGAFLVISVSAFYLIKKRHLEFARASLRIGLLMALVGSPLQLITGHSSAVGVARTQPAKLAAFEGHYAASAPGAMNLFGWVNQRTERVEFSVAIPGMLSWLISGDFQKPVTGLKAFAPEDRPPVNAVFQTYHAMVTIGVALIVLSLLGGFCWLRGTLFQNRGLLWIYVFAVGLPQFANQLGWLSAEVGRQPWIVYGLLRTRDGISRVVGAGETLASLILFSFVYLLLFALFIYLLDHKIRQGPIEEEDGLHGKAVLQ